ncbi:MAG TPA: MFS transporter [Gemmatimonadales bacterium]|nr:MFS transporter [Gemmatimonadales bacterium]
MPAPARRSLLESLGLHRPELRAWAMYDWAASAMQAVIMTAIFPIFYANVARSAGLSGPAATKHWADLNTWTLVTIAVASPILGAFADRAPVKKRGLALFMALGVLGTLLMALVREGQLTFAGATFALALVGATCSFVFYEAMLPHLAAPEEVDRVSSAGYALGYLGGGLLLAFDLVLILAPGRFGLPAGEGLTFDQATLPTRIGFVAVAVWWAGFSLVTLRGVPEPPMTRPARGVGEALRGAFLELRSTYAALRAHPQALLLLGAFLIYNDGISTIIRMATVYGAEIGLTSREMIPAILLVQFIGIPFAFAFGWLADRIGAKPAILLGLALYAGISVLGYRMTTARDFLVLAILVGMVQGGTQALSRSLFANLIPAERSGEFFGLWSVFEKFAGILGPWFFSLAIAVTGSSRSAILGVILFFVVGGAMLARVDVVAGRRAAGRG